MRHPGLQEAMEPYFVWTGLGPKLCGTDQYLTL